MIRGLNNKAFFFFFFFFCEHRHEILRGRQCVFRTGHLDKTNSFSVLPPSSLCVISVIVTKISVLLDSVTCQENI